MQVQNFIDDADERERERVCHHIIVENLLLVLNPRAHHVRTLITNYNVKLFGTVCSFSRWPLKSTTRELHSILDSLALDTSAHRRIADVFADVVR